MNLRQFLFLFLAGMSCAPAAHSAEAEFAFRWNPAQGGPASAKEVLKELGISKAKERTFQVRYLTVKQPAGTPSDFNVLARERKDSDGPESMYKVRGPESAALALAGTECSLVGPKRKEKLEVDVSWAAAAGKPPEVRRVQSWSCSVDAAAKAAFPKALEMQAKGCANDVRRFKSGEWKVEEWSMPKGVKVIEVSLTATDSDESQAKFQKQVVNRLMGLKAVPLDTSKTELGSECP